MKGFSVEENKGVYGAKMKAVGVGGGGCNMINHMIREGLDRIDLIVANTDAQALSSSLAKTKIQLGASKTKGLGAGMEPEVGKEAAQESFEDIKDALEYSDIVFIGAGFGGGTGTGAAPIIARAAKENKALAIGVVTSPFNFEGKKRQRLAREGIEEFKKECDSIIVIPNERLLSTVDKKTGLKDCFKIVDGVLARAVNGMASIILDSGDSDINTDFADVKKILSHRGLALMGVGVSEGDEAAAEALKNAIQSPLLDEMKIDGAMGILVHFKISPTCPLFEVAQAMNIVYDAVDEDADIIFGTTTNENIENNRVEVTLIATGFDTNDKKSQIPSAAEIKDIRKSHIEELRQRVSGSDLDSAYDKLETPTYLRSRMD